MFKTVIFDLDGTILDTLEDLADSANELCRSKGWPAHSYEEFKSFIGYGMMNFVRYFSPEDKKDDESVMKTRLEYVPLYNLHDQDKTHVFEGIPELLKILRMNGIKTGVLTNKDNLPAKKIVEHYLPSLVDEVRGKVPGFGIKPDPAGLKELMKSLDAKEETTLFVGDSGVDVETGHNGHIKVCGVLWGYRNKKILTSKGADFIAENVEELKNIILK